MPVLIMFDKGDLRPFVTVDGKRLPEAAEASVSRGSCVIRDAEGNEIVRVGGVAKAGEADLRDQIEAYFGRGQPAQPAKAHADVRDQVLDYFNRIAPDDA